MNIPEADIGLRPELLALLPFANIDEQHLITLDDIPPLSDLEECLPPRNTTWVLVDHNALQGKLGSLYSDHVVGVIDHHTDEKRVPQDTGSEPRIIESSGSCTSLIVNYCRDAWDNLSSAGVSSEPVYTRGGSNPDNHALRSIWNAQLAQFALGAILIDTHNLQDKDKTTMHDTKAVAFLEFIIASCAELSQNYDRGSIFKQISDAKSNVDSLSLDGVLRKDYKQWSEHGMTLGISSSVKRLSFLQQKAEQGSQDADYAALVKAANTFAGERSLSIFAIMTAFESGNGLFSRELLIIGLSGDGAAAIKTFAEGAVPQLGLEDMKDENDNEQWLRMWRQREVKFSRKQVAPLIRQAMR